MTITITKRAIDTPEKLIEDATSLVKRAIALGRALEKQDMAAVLGFANPVIDSPVIPKVVQPPAVPGIANSLRIVFDKEGRGKDGINAAVAIRTVQGTYPQLTEAQLRASLKMLSDAGEVARVDRGQYRATENLYVPRKS